MKRSASASTASTTQSQKRSWTRLRKKVSRRRHPKTQLSALSSSETSVRKKLLKKWSESRWKSSGKSNVCDCYTGRTAVSSASSPERRLKRPSRRYMINSSSAKRKSSSTGPRHNYKNRKLTERSPLNKVENKTNQLMVTILPRKANSPGQH